MSARLLAPYPAIEICGWLNQFTFGFDLTIYSIDPAVYPYLTIYPAVSVSNTPATNNATPQRSAFVVPSVLPLSSGYPDFNICKSSSYLNCVQEG